MPACAAATRRTAPAPQHGWKAIGGWKFGNTIDGCQAEYVLVPDAMANLAPVPDGLTDEQVLMCPDIMSTGFCGAERGGIRIGDTVAVFAQGPIGLCATAGAKLMGATTIIGVDACQRGWRWRAASAPTTSSTSSRSRPGRGDHAADRRARRRRRDRGAGHAGDLRGRLRVLRPGGTLSSLGVYSSDLTIPLGAFAAGLGDHQIVTTLCPGGKERMRRLMAVIAVRPRRPRPAGHASLQARRHRGGLRPVRPPARRRAEGRDHALTDETVSTRRGPTPVGGSVRRLRPGRRWHRTHWTPTAAAALRHVRRNRAQRPGGTRTPVACRPQPLAASTGPLTLAGAAGPVQGDHDRDPDGRGPRGRAGRQRQGCGRDPGRRRHQCHGRFLPGVPGRTQPGCAEVYAPRQCDGAT